MAIKNSAFRRTYEIQKGFLEDIQVFSIADLLVQFVPFDYHKRKKENFQRYYALLSTVELLVPF